jgi:hypothetical protein
MLCEQQRQPVNSIGKVCKILTGAWGKYSVRRNEIGCSATRHPDFFRPPSIMG